MGSFRRAMKVFPIFIVLSLASLGVSPLHAQDEASITAAGSGVVAPLAQAFSDASGIPLNLGIAGTSRGLQALCSGEVSLAVSTRALSVAEESACAAQGVDFYELLPGFNGLALISSPNSTFAQCLTSAQLNTLFAPTAVGQVLDWSQINPENTNDVFEVILPTVDSANYALLDSLVEGDGLRSDAATVSSDADAIAAVESNPNAVAVVNFENITDAVRTLQLSATAVGCVSPSAESFANRSYPAVEPLFFYANAAQAASGDLQAYLAAVVNENAADIVADTGFTPATEAIFEAGRALLAENNTGREFSRHVSEFQISESVSGTVNIGGAAAGSEFIRQAGTAFTSLYPGATVNSSLLGTVDGARRLCNGEIDMALFFVPLTDEQLANCEAVNVVPITFNLGFSAAALVSNAESEYLQCLTLEQLGAAFAISDTLPVTWDQIDPAFGADTITLFAPPIGSFTTDFLLLASGGTGAINRSDDAIQFSGDFLFRAAAAANVPGALALFDFNDFTEILESDQQNIQPVSIDGSEGCIEPGFDTLRDGSYALARPVQLVVSQRALVRPEVQSFLWFIAGDDQFDLLQNNGISGVEFSELQALRNRLQDEFAEAIAAALIAQPEATPEAEVTSEATAEAGAAPESEATTEATAQAEATVEAAPEAETTPESEATAEAASETETTPESEATAEATVESGS
ncbi:MAG: substrate-binding domain-containing protein [Anaerolineae bacterium]|nr:substrate-binding domain-containing protein [Anaerolineae bacterium]